MKTAGGKSVFSHFDKYKLYYSFVMCLQINYALAAEKWQFIYI